MSFLHPEFLYYMLPPLFILFGLLLTQKEAQATFFSSEVMDRLRVSANTLTLKARNALFLIIGILIVIALAGPVIKEGKIEIKAKSADIMIALDISDSMLATDVYPNRLKLAKQKALEFLRLAPDDRIGIIAFAKNSYLVSPLSFDHEAVAFLLKNLDTNSITEQGTDLMSMLEVVDRSIKNEARRYILLLSDGGDDTDFSKEIAYAKEHNITVFVLGIGTTQGAPIKLPTGEFIKQNGKIIITKLNEKIADLATKTGGVYIRGVNSNSDIKAMLHEIQTKAEKKAMKSEEIEKYIPLFYYPVGLALILLLIATSSMSKRESVQVPSMFMLGLLLFGFTPNAKAGLLDFVDLKEAQEAYKNKNYEASAKYFDKYAKKSESGEAYYNAGNAFYKQKEYKKALQNYKQATFANRKYRAKNFANMGNAYAKLGGEKNLKEAIKAYEDSLKLQDDKEVRENLEAVKKALQKQKQEQKKQQQNKKNKQQQNKDQKKKNQDNKQDQKSDKQKDQNKQSQQNKKDNQNSKDQNKESKQENQKNSDQKEQQNKQEQKDQQKERKSQKQSDEEQKNQEQKSQDKAQKDQEKNKQNKEKKQEKSLEELKSQKAEKKEQKKSALSQAQVKDMKDKMSDAEEKKWLKALNSQQTSYLYRLNKEKIMKDEKNEKPW